MGSYCNECKYCQASALYRGICTKVEPHYIFTESDQENYFIHGLEPEWCPLIIKYEDVKKRMDKFITVERILDEFARDLKSLGEPHFAHINYLHIRQATEDRLVETFNKLTEV